jgi:hypothetical protein
MRGSWAFALIGGLSLLAACKEEKADKSTSSAASTSLAERVRLAVEGNIRDAGWMGMRFRGENVWDQALPAHIAVCGQVSPFADNPDLFVPFVSIVSMPVNGGGSAATFQYEHHIGSTTAEASRVYTALVDYCYDKGGPSPGPVHNVMVTPPLPDNLANPAGKGRLVVLPPAAAATPPPPPAISPTPIAGSPAFGTVIMRQSANLHSDPHGPSIRVIPQGTALRVFAQAPGGWLEVGDSAPWGWMHESMTDRRP